MIAHPGHELRVYGWLELTQPIVFILTDGSGHSGESRLYRTTDLLEKAGARRGSLYGRFTDREVYQAILESDFDFFRQITDELAAALIDQRIEFVVGDAIEGYNPTHDVCRLMLNAAVRKARAANQSIENLDVLLTDSIPDRPSAAVVKIDLDARALSRKLQAASDYTELAADFAAVVEKEGRDSLKTEQLRPVVDDSGAYEFVDPPAYERHGETQVAAGYYERVLHYREHMLPLAAALRKFAERTTLVASSDYK